MDENQRRKVVQSTEERPGAQEITEFPEEILKMEEMVESLEEFWKREEIAKSSEGALKPEEFESLEEASKPKIILKFPDIQKEEIQSLREEETTGSGILRIEAFMKNSPCHFRTVSSMSSRSVQGDSLSERPSVTFRIEENGAKKASQGTEDHVEHSMATPRAMKSLEMPLSPTLFGEHGSEVGGREEAEDDYSASVCAIIQRRNSARKSSRRRKRRRVSSFAVEDAAEIAGASRRRSSVFTTSSGDTAISIEVDQAMMDEEQLQDGGTQEQIFENLKLHKEVISSVKLQPWPLRRKIKLVKQARTYVRRHEGVLQERLAQSRNTRDAVASASLFVNKKWQYFRRELMNLQTWMVPWERRIKEIESHFGSAVASYFVFLRWLFWVNLVVSLILTAFVAIPEVLTADPVEAGERKLMLPEEKVKSKHLLTLWEFEGVLKYSPFFYGWYTNFDPPGGVYRLPLAYFLANLIVYTYSFVAILRKMAENSRMSKLSEKEDECAFSWKLFTGWDFMIGNPETSHNRIASIVLGFKEALLEEAEKEKNLGYWKNITVRVFVNLSVISLLVVSAYAVVEVVARSTQPEADSGWWRQNEITIVMSLISFIFPIFFEILGLFENYHPRKQLRLQLARIMVLNLLNLYSLIFALFDKISKMEVQLNSLKPKSSSPAAASMYSSSNCYNIPVPCDDSSSPYGSVAALASLSLVLMSNMTNSARNTSNFYELLPNETSDEALMGIATSNRSNFYELRANDTPDEALMGIDDFLDIGSSSTSSVQDSINSTTSSTPLSRVNNENNWIRYNGDNERQSNYDYYDDSDYHDPEDDNSTTVVTITSSESTDYSIVSSTSATFSTEMEIESTSSIAEPTVKVDPSIGTSGSGVRIVKCYERVCDVCSSSPDEHSERRNEKVSLSALKRLDMKTRRKLRKLCWETMFGQELAKLTVMDLALTIIATLSIDFFRALFIRYMNFCWCWDLEKQFPQYGDFKIAENILHLVNNQGMVWMGMFFSPGLTALNLLKLGILMYLRSWAVLTCNVPHEVVFRASRSNNFYLALLLTMLFLCVLPVGYAIVWVEPSWHCGPFSGYRRIYHMATQSLKNALPGKTFHKCLDYIASPGIVIPLIVLMALIIYYMVSLANSLREANNDLKIQLRQERTEERRKMFNIVAKRGQGQDTPFTRWKKILPATPIGKSTETPVSRALGSIVDPKNRRESRLRSTNSDGDEATDVEQNSSLPNDPGLSLPEREERADSEVFRNVKNDHKEIKDDRGIPKIRIDGTSSTGELTHDLEQTIYRSDSTI